MLIDFFYSLRDAKLPVSVKEYLTLLEALKAQVISPSLDEFYFLARMALVKDEKYFDKFDRAFGAYFHGITELPDEAFEVPLDWLKKRLERDFTPEEKKRIEAMGGIDKLMERLKELLDEQRTATKAATSGSARAARRHSDMADTTRKASALAAIRPASAAPSRCGTSAPMPITTIRWKSARATSRSPCDACAASRAKARRTNSICPTPFAARQPTPVGSI